MARFQLFTSVALALLLSGIAGSSLAAGPFLRGGFMGLKLAPAAASFYSGPHHAAGPAPEFAGSLGFRLSPAWRVEGEVSYSARGHAGGETQSRLALVNLYYDFNRGAGRFQPFLSIGAGLASHDFYRGGLDGLGLATSSDSSGVWQAGAGLNYQIDDDLSLSGGYRHLGFSDAGGGAISTDDGSHELRLGVTWKLPVTRNHGGPGR